MGILLLASSTQVRFTSILILRVCIDIVFPKLGMNSLPNDYIDHPINLLKVALQHTHPRRLKNLLTHNRHGLSESAFQFELYAILRSILPKHWLCTSEARIHGRQTRLDLLVQDGGNPWAGFELKVNLISEAEFQEPLRQAAGYSQQYTIIIYLVNFILKTAFLPPALRRDGVEGVNIRYNEGRDEFDVHWREVEVDVVRMIDGDITA
ncbi:hypothetical protein EV426DRAFT_580528 [Tirmania nivea]|nr:hypothetical protein EV426DRAFT_580528 [Tirmania nivea]